MNTNGFPVFGVDQRTKMLLALVCLLISMLFAEVFGIVGIAIQTRGAAKLHNADASASVNYHTPADLFAQWQPADVLSALQASELNVEVLPSGKKDGELGMFIPVEEQRFRAHIDGKDADGVILTFYSKEDLMKMENYYRGLNQALPTFKSWVFVTDNVLLQIDGNLPEKQAMRFEQAVNSMGLDY
jgi:hypothetical protein